MDASVATKWVVAEDHSDQAAVLLRYDMLYAPDHWLAEAVNVIWSKVRFGDLTIQDAEPRVELLLRAPIVAAPIAPLLTRAFAISVQNGVTVYDSLYLAMASDLGLPFVTADRRLVRTITDPGLRPLLQWVGDIA